MPCCGPQGLSLPLGIVRRIAVPPAGRDGRGAGPPGWYTNAFGKASERRSAAVFDQEAPHYPDPVHVHRVAILLGQRLHLR
jgi:hypothetical protein